ncbi:MAG: hypothetical protein EOP92_12790 [Lysobacteraceae bacterium]|nr:MAG: hypothetical protein EOP92_12790 [Xanthomonadaceae bacterium]
MTGSMMHQRFSSAVLAALLWFAAACGHAADVLDLSGTWQFALDREDQGVARGWHRGALPDRITLPGILNAQGYGDEISTQTPWVLSLYDKNWHLRDQYSKHAQPGKVKVPFLAQPQRHYLGAAWYGREVVVPPAWHGKRVVLFLERPRWGSTVWVDGREVGGSRSLVAEHTVDLGLLTPGRHRISVRVDNRMLMDYRPDSHSISDSQGMSWNGIVGKLELRATTPVYIDDAQVFPRVSDRSALVRLRIGNAGGKAGTGTVTAKGQRIPVRWRADGGELEFRVQYPKNAKTWDEWSPALHKLDLRLQGTGADDARRLRFGFVEIKAVGKEILVNGRPAFFRGTHDGGGFPLTGYPPTDVASWKKIFEINKAWGINHVRFHSYNPPEAAFAAADEVGIYLQAEPGMWNAVSPGTQGQLESRLRQVDRALPRAGPAAPVHQRHRPYRAGGAGTRQGDRFPRRPAHRPEALAQQGRLVRPRLRSLTRGHRCTRDHPRNRPVDRLPRFQGHRQVHRLPASRELRDLPRLRA